MIYKVAVLCANASGLPTFHMTRIEASLEETREGVQYDRAIEEAKRLGYQTINGTMIAFDEADEVVNELPKLHAWMTTLG